MSQPPINPNVYPNSDHVILEDEALGLASSPAESKFSRRSQHRGHTGTSPEPYTTEAFASTSRSDPRDSATRPLLGVYPENAESKHQSTSGFIRPVNEPTTLLLQPIDTNAQFSSTSNIPPVISDHSSARQGLVEGSCSSSNITGTVPNSAPSVEPMYPSVSFVEKPLGTAPLFPVVESPHTVNGKPYPSSGSLYPPSPVHAIPYQTHPPIEPLRDCSSKAPEITPRAPRKHGKERILYMRNPKTEPYQNSIFFICCLLIILFVLVSFPYIVILREQATVN